MYGPQAALIAECFTPRLRYSGASLGYQLASVIAGGPVIAGRARCDQVLNPRFLVVTSVFSFRCHPRC
jgi:hypothetical protein